MSISNNLANLHQKAVMLYLTNNGVNRETLKQIYQPSQQVQTEKKSDFWDKFGFSEPEPEPEKPLDIDPDPALTKKIQKDLLQMSPFSSFDPIISPKISHQEIPELTTTKVNHTLAAYFLKPSLGINSESHSFLNFFNTLKNIDNLNLWLNTQNLVMGYDLREYDNDKKYQWTSNVVEQLIDRVDNIYNYQGLTWHKNQPSVFGEKIVKRSYTEYKDPVFVQKVIIKNPKEAKVMMIGDLHSSLTSLLNILRHMKEKGIFKTNFLLPKNYYLFFLGDIVDRGPYGLELMALAMTLKHYNPQSVYIINGNHEDRDIYVRDGFEDEMDKSLTPEIKQKMSLFMTRLPSAIFLQIGNKNYQLCHGAIANQEHHELLEEFISSPRSDLVHLMYRQEKSDNLKWGDFHGNLGQQESDRGSDLYEYGTDIVQNYLRKLNLTAILSGHQDYANLLFQLPPHLETHPKMSQSSWIYPTLQMPKGYDQIQPPQKLTYTPGIDFQALVTSSCYMAKKNPELKFDTWIGLLPN